MTEVLTIRSSLPELNATTIRIVWLRVSREHSIPDTGSQTRCVSVEVSRGFPGTRIKT